MNTYYLLKRGKEVVLQNENDACFAEIFTSFKPLYLPKLENWQELSIEFIVDPTISKEEIQKFLARCKVFRVKTSLAKISKEEIPLWRPEIQNQFEAETKDVYKVVIKFSDCKDLNFVKFAILVTRSLIEDADVVKEYVKHPIPQGVQKWQFFKICAAFTGRGRGHGYFSNLFFQSYVGNISFYKNLKFEDVREKIRTSTFDDVASRSQESEIQENTSAEKILPLDRFQYAVKLTQELNKLNK